MVERLIRRIKKHDRQAMAELYQQYVELLSSVCYRYVPSDDAKDVLQNSFVKIFTAIPTFDYQGDKAFYTWMIKIVTNEALGFLKERKRLSFVDINESTFQQAADDPPVEGLSADEIHQLVSQLPDGYRTVLNLFVFEGYSHQQIGEMLGIKAATSASQFHHAKCILAKKIKYLMEKKNGKRLE